MATPSSDMAVKLWGDPTRSASLCRPPKISLPLIPRHPYEQPADLYVLHTTCAANSERSLLRSAQSRQRRRSCNWPSLECFLPFRDVCSALYTTQQSSRAGGIRQRFEFSSEIESFNHAGFCSSSCRLPLDPLRTTITLRSLAFPGPISAMISATAAAGKNGEAVGAPDADGRGLRSGGRKNRPMTILMRRKCSGCSTRSN